MKNLHTENCAPDCGCDETCATPLPRDPDMDLAHELAVTSTDADSPAGFVAYRNRLAAALAHAREEGRADVRAALHRGIADQVMGR